MKKALAAPLALAALSSTALAGGLDRTGQSVNLIFEDGTYAEFGIATTSPSLSGNDLAALNPAETATGNVGNNFTSISAGFKTDINEKLSFGVIFDQPWGVDVAYTPAASGGSALLGGTSAKADSDAITALLRYKLNDRFSVHGGLRYQAISGDITLDGAAYGGTPPAGVSGYNVKVNRDTGFGWVAGFAYEIPEIALRAALTYSSAIDHDFELNESFSPTAATAWQTETPQSVNLDFQTGVAKDTLAFAGIRWVDHSPTTLSPPALAGAVGSVAAANLISLDNSTTYTIGVGRRFNQNWSGSLAYIYEDVEGDNLVSPLAPTHGMQALRLGVQYTNGKIKVAGGVRYTLLNDAFAETGTPDVARASFDGNSAVSFAVKVGYYF